MIHLCQQVPFRLSILPLLIVIMMEMMIVMVNQELDLKNLVQGIPTRFISWRKEYFRWPVRICLLFWKQLEYVYRIVVLFWKEETKVIKEGKGRRSVKANTLVIVIVPVLPYLDFIYHEERGGHNKERVGQRSSKINGHRIYGVQLFN